MVRILAAFGVASAVFLPAASAGSLGPVLRSARFRLVGSLIRCRIDRLVSIPRIFLTRDLVEGEPRSTHRSFAFVGASSLLSRMCVIGNSL